MRTIVDRAWPVFPLTALALAVVVVVIGIVAAPATSDVQRIRDTVHDFAGALQESRGADACALLTPAAQAAVAARTRTLDCPTTLRTFGIGIDPAALDASHITGATVSGTTATVARQQLVQPDGTPFGGGLTLERSGGGWRIAGLS